MLYAYNHYQVLLGNDIQEEDWMKVTKAQFDNFRLAQTHDYNKIILSSSVATTSGTNSNTSSTPSHPTSTLVKSFRKGIKQDQNLFPELKDEENNDAWHRSFETQAHAQDVANVLDDSDVPSDTYHDIDIGYRSNDL
jgi:hypothetical protein